MLQVMIDSKSFKKKPIGSQVGAIQKRLENISTREVESLEAVKNAIEEGKTIRPGMLAMGSSKGTDFIAGQLLMIDVDTYDSNGIEATMNKAMELNLDPCIIYKSFSYKMPDTKETIGREKIANPNYNKLKYNHRIGFKLPVAITDADKFLDYINALIDVFDADESCKDAGRLIFGTCYKSDYFNDVDVDLEVLDKIVEQYKAKKIATVKKSEKKVSKKSKKASDTNPSSSQAKMHLYCNSSTQTREQYRVSFKEMMLAVGMTGLKQYKIDGILTFRNVEQFTEAMKKLNLAKLLGVDESRSFKCIFHNDRNASTVCSADEDGYYYYRCFSNNCEIGNRSLDIFNIVSYLETGKLDNFKEAFVALLKMTEAKIEESNWYKAQTSIIKSGRYFINGLSIKKDEHSSVQRLFNKTVRAVYEVMLTKAEYQLDLVKDDSQERELAFSVSYNYLAERCGGFRTITNNKDEVKYETKAIREAVHRLALLGFIDVLTDREVAKDYKELDGKAQALREKNMGDNKTYRTINTYRIKKVDTALLENAKEIIKACKEKGILFSNMAKTVDTVIGTKVKSKAKKGLTKAQEAGYKPLRKYFYDALRAKKYVIKKDYLAKAKKLNVHEKTATALFPLISQELGAKKVSKKYLEEKKIKLSKTLSPNSTLFSNI